MKKICSFLLSLVMLSSAFSMFSVASAESEAADIYVPTEYAMYDFTDAGEASDFSSDKTLTVSDGKLVLSDVSDYDAHYITKSVNIPTGQSFALEMSTDDLYTNGAVKVSLNGAETLMVRNVAKTGDWSFYFDRINGIKVFFNGTEVSTDTSVSPYLSYSPTTPVKDITSISIAVQGSATLKPKFDYFRVYGYGDAYTHRLSFDDASDLEYFDAKSGTNTVSDGKWNVTGVKEIWPKRVGFTADTTQDLIVDFQLTHPETNKVVSIKPQWKGDSKNYGNVEHPSGIHTAVYNRSTDTIGIYKDGTQRATSTLGLTTTPIDFVGFGVVMNSSSTKISFDYYDVYVQGMKAEVSDVTTAGLKLYANTPLDLTRTELSVNGDVCTVTKAENGYLTYDITFTGDLESNTNYVLTGNLLSVFGREKAAELSFTSLKEEETEPRLYTHTEYAMYDFADAGEASAFSSDKTLTVSDGKLVLSDVSDYDAHYITKSVNIPTGQSFALEMSTDDLYTNGAIKVSLNGTETLMVRNVAKTGDWSFYFDRINGIKVFFNGTEVSTDTSVSPYLSYSPTTPVKDITSIKIAVQGGANLKPKFDYFRVYGYGDAYTHRLSFDDASDLEYFESTSGTNTVSDGKWNVTGVKEIWPKRVGFTADITQDLIVDMQLTHPDTFKVVAIKPQWKGDTKNYGNIQYPSGIHTAVYNRSTDTIGIYKDGTQRATSTLGLTTTPIDFVGFGVMMNSTSTISFDYYDVYVQGMIAEVSNVTESGLKLYTNTPLDLLKTELSVNGDVCTVTKAENGYCTYDVTFTGNLESNTDYVLAGNLVSVFGREKAAELPFTSVEKTEPEDSIVYFGSEFENEADVNNFGIDGTDVTKTVEEGFLKISSNVEGDKYPYITKDGFKIPADENFVLDFEMSDTYKYATNTIRFNDTDVFVIKANNGKPNGKYRLVVDCENGMKLYKDGALMPLASATNTTYAEEKTGATSLLDKEITSFELKVQLNGNVQKIDYINAYIVPSEFVCKTDGEIELQDAKIITTQPLDLQNTTANVGNTSATITETGYCKYDIHFNSPVAVNQEYTLTVNATTVFGTIKTFDFLFKVDGAPFRYIENDFDSEEELAEFVCDTTFSVSEGKLIGQGTGNTVVQSFSKEVNIPADLGFVLELNAENLYRYSDLEIELNGAYALKLNANGSTQALDGSWKIIFDRVAGISAYKDGVLIGDSGNPKVNGTPAFVVSDVTNIKLKFRGTDNVAPKFDYIRAYSLGENVRLISDYSNYDGSDYIIDRYNTRHDIVITDGKVQPHTSEQYTLTKDVAIDNTKNFIIDFKVTNSETYKNLRVMLNGSSIYEYKPNGSKHTGEYRVAINSNAKSGVVYKDGTMLATLENISIPDSGVNTVGVFVFGTTSQFDYFNVYYAKDTVINLLDSGVFGFTIATTEPLDTESIIVKNGEVVISASVKEAEDICVYNISPIEQLDYSKEYTLTINAKTLQGADALGEVRFATPAFEQINSYYSDDFSSDKNDKRFNSDSGKGTMAVIDGNLSIKSNGNGYPQYFTGYFNVDKSKVVVETRMKIPYGTQHSSTGFKLEVNGTRYDITNDIKPIYEWTVFDILLDFETHKAKLFKDGIYVSEKEFATDKTVEQILAAQLSINHRFYLTGKEALVDYISVFAVESEFDVLVKEKNGKKILLQSTNPIDRSTLTTDAFSIDGVNVLNVKPLNDQPCVYELALDRVVDEAKAVAMNIQGIKDIMGNTFNGGINIGGDVVINSVVKESVLGKVRYTVNYTNNGNSDEDVVFVLNLRRNNGSYYMSKLINLTLEAETENAEIITEYIYNPFNFTDEYFILDGLDSMTRIY